MQKWLNQVDSLPAVWRDFNRAVYVTAGEFGAFPILIATAVTNERSSDKHFWISRYARKLDVVCS